MPSLPWDITVLLAIMYVTLALLIAEISKVSRHVVVWTSAYFKLRPRPAVIAAANRGLHQRDQSNDRQ